LLDPDEANNGSGNQGAELGPGARRQLLELAFAAPSRADLIECQSGSPATALAKVSEVLLPSSSFQLLSSLLLAPLLHAHRIFLGAAAKRRQWGTGAGTVSHSMGNVIFLVFGTVFLAAEGAVRHFLPVEF
jgi:hypothetical protein